MVPAAVSVFILPPSGAELAARLRGRGSEDSDRQRRRLLAARDELRVAPEFDYLLVNEDVESAVDAIEGIMAAEGARTSRFPDLQRYVTRLVEEVDAMLDA